jgi:hypothetical protein
MFVKIREKMIEGERTGVGRGTRGEIEGVSVRVSNWRVKVDDRK